MVFSDTTNQQGLVQSVEFWARLPYGSSGNTLKEITARINRAFDFVLPILLSHSDYVRWDDTNQTDQPIGYVGIFSGQPDYKVTSDGNSLSIINLTNVRILQSTTATKYVELTRMYINDGRALDAMSPDSSLTGIPTHFLEVNNTIYLYPKPNYSKANGIELFFERQQSYFASTDTTKVPGIPSPYHELLALIAAQDIVMVNRPDDMATIDRIQVRINEMKSSLDDTISMKTRTQNRMTTAYSTGASLGNNSGSLNTGNLDSNK